MARRAYPHTPDGRYFVSKGRLWRCTDPRLSEPERQALVRDLMTARRAVKLAGDNAESLRKARAAVHRAKVALGERGPVWWDDGAEPVDNFHPKNTPYANWWRSLSDEERASGEA